jgi:hypothetical protein
MTLKRYLEYAWLAVLALFVVYYGIEKWDVLKAVFSTLAIRILAEALLLIVLGKLVLVYVMQKSCERFSLNLPFIACFSTYNLTQMAKYVPGSVWQFVSRFAILKERGGKSRQIRDAIVSEHLWVVGFAAVAGIVLVSYRYDLLLPKLAGAIASLDPAWTTAFVGALMLISVGVAMALCRWGDFGRLRAWAAPMIPPPRILVALVFGWLAFGLAFWITTPPFAQTPPPWLYTAGVYCIAYAVGFLVPLAPAGLGIREAVIALCMTPYLGLDYAILLASLNRGLYFVAELMLFSIALPLRPGQLGLSPPSA